MIINMEISNYRSLDANTVLSPSSLTVLVGPNGSGKSNLLDVLSFVRDSVTQGLPAAITHRGGVDSIRRKSQGRPFDVRIKLEVLLNENTKGHYEFVITGDRKEEYRVKREYAYIKGEDGQFYFERKFGDFKSSEGIVLRIDEQSLSLTALGGVLEFKPLVDYFSNMAVYSIYPDTLRVPQKFSSARPMEEHGSNWVSILRDLVKDSDLKEELIKGLNKLTGDIEDVKVTSAAGHLIAEFKQKSKGKTKQWFDAAQQSDGTLRVAGLLTALLQRPPLPVIGIEEPELTVHPGVIPMLYDYIKQSSEISQIFITTHSPVFLDYIRLEEDALYVAQRVDGITNLKKADKEHLDPVKKNLLTLGEYFQSGDLQMSLFDV